MHPWYFNAVIYSVDVSALADSNADGRGDIEGVIARLDYVTSLGVSALWLQPFHPSPFRDDGYDVTDYFNVSDRFGDLGDLTQLIEEAENRGIKVISDLIVNHTSDQHPWFREALRDPSSKFRDYYVWADEPHDVGAVQQFPGEQDGVWAREPGGRQYYLHRFYDFQPDLNLANAAVRTHVLKIMEFWLRLGVSGFRVDAAPYVSRKAGWDPSVRDRYAFIEQMRAEVAAVRPHGVLIGETDVDSEEYGKYFAEGHGMNLLLNFWLNQHVFLALARESCEPIVRALEELPTPPVGCCYANWLRNHDELDLERLEPHERAEVLDAFAPAESMRLYGRGLRRRLAPMLGCDAERLRMAHALLFSLPGVPIVRYGDEIGMGEDLTLPGRVAVRTPMQWSRDANAGFSAADPHELYRPIAREQPFRPEDGVNVMDQWLDPGSLLHCVSRLVRARRQTPEIASNAFDVLDTGEEGVLGVRYPGAGIETVTLVNITKRPLTAKVKPLENAAFVGELVSDRRYEPAVARSRTVDLGPYGYRWFKLRPE